MFQLPTDNLYKFLALSGLIILGFSIVYPFKRVYEIQKEQINLGGELNILRLQAAEPLPSLEMHIRKEQLRTKVELEHATIEQIWFFKELVFIGGITGASLMILGFTLWYRKVQKPQDLIVANQAAASEAAKTHEPPADSTQSGTTNAPDVQH